MRAARSSCLIERGESTIRDPFFVNLERASFIVRSDEQLHDSVDPREARARIPESYQAKGMFLDGLACRLGRAELERLIPELVDPPRGGRYTTFRDYPQRDYFTLAWAIHRAEHPALASREGLRRVARQDFLTFGHSMIGRVVLAIARDPVSALLQMPAACERTVVGQEMKATQIGRSSVRLEVSTQDDGWERTLGQAEGVALHYRMSTTTTIVVTPTRYTLDVELTRAGEPALP